MPQRLSTQQIETRAQLADILYTWEVIAWGRASFEAKCQRHDYLKKLLARQLENFDKMD